MHEEFGGGARMFVGDTSQFASGDTTAKLNGPPGGTRGFLSEGFPDLTRSAREYIRHHAREARLAVTVTFEAAAAQSEMADGDPFADMPDTLRRFIVRRAGGEDIIGVAAVC